MNLSIQHLPEPHPVETGWVDDALSTAYADGDPLGALIGGPLGGDGQGIMIVGWPGGGPGPFALVEALRGPGTGPARCMQVVAFDGPRSPQWVAAEQFASTHRLWPATRDVQGIVWVLRLRAADNATTVVLLAETPDAVDEGIRAVLSTQLLPGEDPALLTGPDRLGVYRLMHADLPIEALDAGTEGRTEARVERDVEGSRT